MRRDNILNKHSCLLLVLLTLCSLQTGLAVEITEPDRISESYNRSSTLLRRFESINEDAFLPVTSGEQATTPLTALINQLDDVSLSVRKEQVSPDDSKPTPTTSGPDNYHPDFVQQLMHGIRDSVRESPEARQFIEDWRVTLVFTGDEEAPPPKNSQLPTRQPKSSPPTPPRTGKDRTNDGIDHASEMKDFINDWIDRLTHPLTILLVSILLIARIIYSSVRDRSTSSEK